MQASGLEHLIKDDISDTGKNKFDVVRIGGRSQMWIDWPFFQIDLTLAQKSIDYEVGGFRHIVFTLKLGKIVWLTDYYPSSIYSCSIGHILEYEICHLGCLGSK